MEAWVPPCGEAERDDTCRPDIDGGALIVPAEQHLGRTEPTSALSMRKERTQLVLRQRSEVRRRSVVLCCCCGSLASFPSTTHPAQGMPAVCTGSCRRGRCALHSCLRRPLRRRLCANHGIRCRRGRAARTAGTNIAGAKQRCTLESLRTHHRPGATEATAQPSSTWQLRRRRQLLLLLVGCVCTPWQRWRRQPWKRRRLLQLLQGQAPAADAWRGTSGGAASSGPAPAETDA